MDKTEAEDYWNKRTLLFGKEGRGLKAVGAVGLPNYVNLYVEGMIRKAILES